MSFSRRGRIASFHRQLGKLDLPDRHDGFPNETFDKYPALGIDDKRAERFAELFFKRVANRLDIRSSVKRKSGGQGAFDVELAAVEHIQLEYIRGLVQIEPVASQIALSLLDE